MPQQPAPPRAELSFTRGTQGIALMLVVIPMIGAQSVLTDIPQMPSKFVEIVLRSRNQRALTGLRRDRVSGKKSPARGRAEVMR